MEVKVFQIDSDLDTKRMGFRKLASADPSGEKNIDSEIYKPVYETEIESAVDMNPFEILENLFRQTNIGERPEGYTGHSLSVSDVVQLGPDFYFCDSFGFEKLNSFSPADNPQEEGFQVECDAMLRSLFSHIRDMDGDDLAALVRDIFVVDVSCEHDDERGRLLFNISPRPDTDEDFRRYTYGSAKETFKDAIINKPSGPKMG